MRIVALVENTALSPEIKAKHGLCFYIETPKHKLLFDVGPNETFVQNAKQLGVDIAAVDTVVISHGHKDHGGGLQAFLQQNQTATVYLHKAAFAPHYAKVLFAKVPVGLDASLQNHQQVELVDGTLRIDEELLVFSDVEGSLDSLGNRALLGPNGQPDNFQHEQNLLITLPGETVLFTGCSHRGIHNIVPAALRHTEKLNTVIGGFHLYNPINKKAEPQAFIEDMARRLDAYDTTFYTCHCTGQVAFDSMKGIMGDKLRTIAAGQVLE